MKLSNREKYLVTVSGVVILILIISHFFVLPFFKKKEQLQKNIIAKEAALNEILKMSAEYKTLKKGGYTLNKLLDKRKKDFTLFSFLEQAAANSSLKDYIKYMKPSSSNIPGLYKESMIEMKLEGITLKKFVEYIYYIESSENVVQIKRVSIKENKKKAKYLDVVLTVLTLSLK